MNNPAKINKIALLLYGLHGGGAERVMLTLANAWAAQGITVDFLIGLMEGPYTDMLGSKLNVFVFNKRTKALLPSVVSYLNEHQPDILLSTLQPVNVMAAMAGKFSSASTKVILREANSPVEKLKERKGWASKFYFKYLPRFAYPFADGYIAVSEGLKEEMHDFYKLPKKKIKTIYNPVVDDHLYKMAALPIDHPALNTDEKIILAMGRVVPQKDFTTLFSAFAKVNKSIPSRLVIVGKSDADKKHFQTLMNLAIQLGIKERIYFVGFQKNPFAFFKRADVFVLSSKFEGLPGVLIQALACGCPVVSTNCPHGPLEILQDGKYGHLVPMEDSSALANAIKDSLTPPLITIDSVESVSRFNRAVGVQEYLKYFESLFEVT